MAENDRLVMFSTVMWLKTSLGSKHARVLYDEEFHIRRVDDSKCHKLGIKL